MENLSRKEHVEVKVIEAVVYIRKYILFSLEFSCKLVCKNPFVASFAFFLFFLYSCFPSLFAFLVSSFPVLSCTALLLGILLSYGEPNIPEIEEEIVEEEKIYRKVSFQKAGKSVDGYLLSKDENYTLDHIVESRVEIEEKISKKLSSDGGDERSNDFLAAFPSVKVVNTTGEKHIVEREFLQNLKVLRKEQSESDLKSEFSDGVSEEIEGLMLKISKPMHDDWLDSSLRSSWQPILDSATDFESEAESSSPDASMTNIVPMLDESRPLLDSRTPYRALKSADSSDLELSQQHESDEDSAEQADECKIEEKDESSKAVTWTADDQKNLMDLGSSDLERNQRLESLIARRRARKNQIIIFEKDLIDLHSNETAKDELFRFHPQIPPINALRRNAFALSHDTDVSEGLPPIPGSAPSVLLGRQNPFDFLCNNHDSSKDIEGESLCRPVFGSSQRGYSFRRQESFASHSALPINLMHEKRGSSRLNPNFVAEKMDSKGNDHVDFHVDLRRDNDSKSKLISALNEVSSVDQKVPTEQKSKAGISLLRVREHDNETGEKNSSSYDDEVDSELGKDDDFSDPNPSSDATSCIAKEVFEENEPDLLILDVLNHEEVEVKQDKLTIFSLPEKAKENSNINSHEVLEAHKQSPSVLNQSSEFIQSSDASVRHLIYTNQTDVPIYDSSPSRSQIFLANNSIEGIEDSIFEAISNVRAIKESKQSSASCSREIMTLSSYMDLLDEDIFVSKGISEAGEQDFSRCGSLSVHEDYGLPPSKVGIYQSMEKVEMQESFGTYKNDNMFSGLINSMKFPNLSRKYSDTGFPSNDDIGNSQNDTTNDFQINQSVNLRSLITFHSEVGNVDFEAGEMQIIDDRLLSELDAIGDFQVEESKRKDGEFDLCVEDSDLRPPHASEIPPNKTISINLNYLVEKDLVFNREGTTESGYWFWGTSPVEDLTVYKPKMSVLEAFVLEELNSGELVELIEENPQDAVQTLAGNNSKDASLDLIEDERDFKDFSSSPIDFLHNDENLYRNGCNPDLVVVNTSGYDSTFGLTYDSESSKTELLLGELNISSRDLKTEKADSKLLVLEAKSIEDIHSSFNQTDEEDLATPFYFSDLDLMTTLPDFQVTEPSSLDGENLSELFVLETRSAEDIKLAFEYFSPNFSVMATRQIYPNSIKANHDLEHEVMEATHSETPYNMELLQSSELINSDVEQVFVDLDKPAPLIDVVVTMPCTTNELEMAETWSANSKNYIEPSLNPASSKPGVDSDIMDVKYFQTSIDQELLALDAKCKDDFASGFKSSTEGLDCEAGSTEEASSTLKQAPEAFLEMSLPSDVSKTTSQQELELRKFYPDHDVVEKRSLVNGDNNLGLLVLESGTLEGSPLAFNEDAENSSVESFTALNYPSYSPNQEVNISDFPILKEDLALAFRQVVEDCISQPMSKVESFYSSEKKNSENIQSAFSDAHTESHKGSSFSVISKLTETEDNKCNEAENNLKMIVIEVKSLADTNSDFKQDTDLISPLNVRSHGRQSASSSSVFEAEYAELEDQDHNIKSTFHSDLILQVDNMEDNLLRKKDPKLLYYEEKSVVIDSTRSGSNQTEARAEFELKDSVLPISEAVLVSDGNVATKQVHKEEISENHQDVNVRCPKETAVAFDKSVTGEKNCKV